MDTIRIGIICPSEIALRRFMPALQQIEKFRFTAIAIASPREWFGEGAKVSGEEIQRQQESELGKARAFTSQYGGEIIIGYENLVSSDRIDAVYIPLPPALHYRWARLALQHGKHVMVEKPSTTSMADTDDLISIASDKGLALHENYMFVFHKQLEAVRELVESGEIGNVRLYRISFGFPLRAKTDFRYNKALGGGALLDAGGYVMKYASYLLGDTARVVAAQANGIDGYEVEMYGSATMANDKGDIAQLAFGMDNDYKCDIEIWGSRGTLTSGRILTAPAGFTPTCTIKRNQDIETRELPPDDAFRKSLEHFASCINDTAKRQENYAILHRQEHLVEQFRDLAKM